MKRISKRISAFIAAAILAISMGGNAMAVVRPITLRPLIAPVTANPNADVIIWRYRVNNGVYEHRRWNVTKGVWVDPEWMPVP